VFIAVLQLSALGLTAMQHMACSHAVRRLWMQCQCQCIIITTVQQEVATAMDESDGNGVVSLCHANTARQSAAKFSLPQLSAAIAFQSTVYATPL